MDRFQGALHDSGSTSLGHSSSEPEKTTFVNDRWLAERLKMKAATIRSQRFKRRHGLDHWLDLDPVMIGTKPRYRLSEALAWLEARGAKKVA